MRPPLSPLHAPLIALGLSASLAVYAAPPIADGPAGGDPFLDDPFAHPKGGLTEHDGTLYRVTGVDDDDVLNIRDIPGVADSTIMRALAPDAVNIRLTGDTATVNGATWYQVTSSALPGGSGWVHSAFITAQDPEKTPSLGPEFKDVPTADYGQLYTGIEGYTQIDAQAAQEEWLEAAAGDDYNAFRQFNRAGPLTRALLLTRHREGTPQRVRYRLRLGMEQVGGADTPGGPRPISFVQIDALEMTPDGIADGSHVSYRMLMSPVQTRTADISALSRRELPAGQVEEMTCLGLSCAEAGPIAEMAQSEWQDSDPPSLPEASPYPALTDDGVHSPETLLTMLANNLNHESGWQWPEAREGVSFGAPFLEAVVEVNPGQDFSTDVVLRDTALNDTSTAEAWTRATSIAATGDEPLLGTMVYHKPRPPMPPTE